MATTALSDADREHMCKKLMELIEHCQKCLEDMQYNERLCRTWLENLRSGTPLKLTEVQDSLDGYDGLRTIGRIGRDWCLWHARTAPPTCRPGSPNSARRGSAIRPSGSMRWSEEKMEPYKRSPRADWPRGVDGDPFVWPSPSGPRAARYYVSQAVLQNRKDEAGSIARVAAPDISVPRQAHAHHEMRTGSHLSSNPVSN